MIVEIMERGPVRKTFRVIEVGVYVHGTISITGTDDESNPLSIQIKAPECPTLVETLGELVRKNQIWGG